MKNFAFILLTALFLCSFSCSSNPRNDPPANEDRYDLTITSKTVIPSFAGIGPQWGGYDNVRSWMPFHVSLSNVCWNKLFARLRFMKPPLVRIMVSPGWNYDFPPASNGNNFEKNEHLLFKILDFCETEGIDVIFGEWGHRGGTGIDADWLDTAVDFYEYLVRTKAYACIKYYNMVNEPNGDWSSIAGNFDLWKRLIEAFHEKIVERDLDSAVAIIGPDVAIWDTHLVGWVRDTGNQLGQAVTVYDIHTYPTEEVVRSGAYLPMIQSYRSAVPESALMIMGEAGFKYSANSELGRRNAALIAADKYASDDSNMMIYEAFYGVDMADLVIQNMLAGYAGIILWSLDDAMYNVTGKELKRWGFWNILGSEAFENVADENIRPWFYTMSLLSKYFPKGTDIKTVILPVGRRGLRAVAGVKDGKYSVAIVNSHDAGYSVNPKMEDGIEITGMKKYSFVAAAEGDHFTGAVDAVGFAAPEKENVTLDLSNTVKMEIAPRSFVLYTNLSS